MLLDLNLAGAQNELLKAIVPLSSETIPIMEALGRVSSRDLLAPWNLPSYPQAAVDGFAVHIDDSDASKSFQITEYLNDGDIPAGPLESGLAVGVITGGPLPEATGAVIPRENARVEGKQVAFTGEIKAGSNIKLPGEDFLKREILAPSGTRLEPGLISLLAAFGYNMIPVYSRPRVGIISLGHQVVPHHSSPLPGEIRDSNGPLLNSLIRLDGGEVDFLEYSGEKSQIELKNSILNLLERVDLLITTGGTYSRNGNNAQLLFKDLGAKMLFWDIPIQPGGHNGAALLNSKILISLSGNPAACAVGYQLFASPVMRAFQEIEPYPQRIQARCTNAYPRKGGPHRFLRGYACCGSQGWTVRVLPGQKPGMLRSLINCNALIELPAEHSPLEAGAEVSVILLHPSSHTGENYLD